MQHKSFLHEPPSENGYKVALFTGRIHCAFVDFDRNTNLIASSPYEQLNPQKL